MGNTFPPQRVSKSPNCFIFHNPRQTHDLGKFSTNRFKSLEKAGVKRFTWDLGKADWGPYVNAQLSKMTA